MFTAGKTIATIAIPIINDTMIEEKEAFMLMLNLLPTTRITLGAHSTAIAMIIDTSMYIIMHSLNMIVFAKIMQVCT